MVTNNLLVVTTLANAPGVHVTLIGGDLRGSSMSTLGPLAELTLSRLSADTAFLGADGVVAEFGTVLPDDIEVRVWDSTAEIRYLVLPERPAGTDGLSEEELAALVTRNGMIGTERL